jgi:hypothetical protein
MLTWFLVGLAVAATIIMAIAYIVAATRRSSDED